MAEVPDPRARRGIRHALAAQSSRVRAALQDVLAEPCGHSDQAFRAAFDRIDYLMLH